MSGLSPWVKLEDWEIVHRMLSSLGINRPPRNARVGDVARGQHYSSYNQVYLRHMLEVAGLTNMQFCAFGFTKFEIFTGMDRRSACCIHVEAMK